MRIIDKNRRRRLFVCFSVATEQKENDLVLIKKERQKGSLFITSKNINSIS
jgi:hypothetical protein